MNNPVWKTGVTTLCRAYVVTFISCLLGAENTLDVCKAAKVVLSGNQSTLIIRGTGQVLDEGLVVGSMSCPIAKMWYGPLPTMIVVSITSSATPAAKARFSRAEKEVGLASPMLDVVVRGALTCQKRMRFIKNGREIIGAYGFGYLGLGRCKMEAAELLEIKDSKEQPPPDLAPTLK